MKRASDRPIRTLLASISLLILAAVHVPAWATNAYPTIPIDPESFCYQDLGPGAITWFGDNDGPGGRATIGDVWDFTLGDLQGWTSIDLTDEPARFHRVTPADFVGSPANCTITAGGSTASVWLGVHQAEAEARGWAGGQGYGNNWSQSLSKTFPLGDSEAVIIEFDYFVDTETKCDFVYVYVVDDSGVRTGPLNGSANGRAPDGKGYSGSVVEGTNIGTPVAPAHDQVQARFFEATTTFDVVFEFRSDYRGSDERDCDGSVLNTACGAFGVDNIVVTSASTLADTSDFEAGNDGWTATAGPAVGKFAKVEQLANLDPIQTLCSCGIDDWVLIASDLGAGDFPHPKRQQERLVSNPAYVGPGSGAGNFNTAILQWEVYEDLPVATGVGYRPGVQYYPWTDPQTGVVGWSLDPIGDCEFIFTDSCDPFNGCRLYTVPVCRLPTNVDSVRAVFDVISDCEAFATPEAYCDGPDNTNQTPYLDNIQLGVGLLGGGAAPFIAGQHWFQDAFPVANSLLPNQPANMDVFHDLNFGSGEPFSTVRGDSAVVCVSCEPNTEVYLNFRVFPGPDMDVSDPWFTKYGADSRYNVGPAWVAARMDTAEHSTGPVDCVYMSYLHELDPAFSFPEQTGAGLNPANEILPDNFFTPGTRIEYYFSTYRTGMPFSVNTWPIDAPATCVLEVDVLPGFFDVSGETLAPCLLYVNATSTDVQGQIEEFGLDPVFGTVVDDDGLEHDAWDRFDYTRASSNHGASLGSAMTGYQSYMYYTIGYNTGTQGTDGVRDDDAERLINFLANDDLGRWDTKRGVWMSGNGIGRILFRPDRLFANSFLVNIAEATYIQEYRQSIPDYTPCIRLDPSAARDFPTDPLSYASAEGDCVCFDILSPIVDGAGNLDWADQDAGGLLTMYASVSNDQSVPDNPANYGVVLDAFSPERLRTTPAGWTGAICAPFARVATARRVNDVIAFLGSGTLFCSPETIAVSTPDGTPDPVTRTWLFQNAPNPFNPSTTIRYDLAESAHVRLEVFDVTGRRVRVLVDESQTPLRYTVRWDGLDDGGSRVASGVYWARLTTSRGFSATTKMAILK